MTCPVCQSEMTLQLVPNHGLQDHCSKCGLALEHSVRNPEEPRTSTLISEVLHCEVCHEELPFSQSYTRQLLDGTVLTGHKSCVMGAELEKEQEKNPISGRCQVVDPFVFRIGDLEGHLVSMSLNRGRQFDYKLEGNFLVLMTNTMTLTIPASEFSKFKVIPSKEVARG